MKRKIITGIFIIFSILLIIGCKKNNEFSKGNNELKINNNSVLLIKLLFLFVHQEVLK